MVIQDSNVSINVKDMNASVAFYESIGFKLKQRWDDHYAQLTAPGLVIGLHPHSASNEPTGSGTVSLGFTTESFELSKAELQQKGIEFTERDEEGGKFLHFTDPDGTQLYIIKPKW